MHPSNALDNDNWSSWIGRSVAMEQYLDPSCLQALAATLNVDSAKPLTTVPPAWHWAFFNAAVPHHQLAEDGHPRRDLPGSLLPPVPLPRRMWAGSRIQYIRPLPINVMAQKVSTIARIAPKTGRSGEMCFVTLEHTISVDGDVCLIEHQDIVYREASRPRLEKNNADHINTAQSTAPQEQDNVVWTHQLTPDQVMLWRYSAVTFNAHRIHYDLPYAQSVEGYESLVVHGPLTATLLHHFACTCLDGRVLHSFEFKGLSPLYVGKPLQLQAWPAADDACAIHLRAINSDGVVAMSALAKFKHC